MNTYLKICLLWTFAGVKQTSVKVYWSNSHLVCSSYIKHTHTLAEPHTKHFNEANPVLITSVIAGNQCSSWRTINHTRTQMLDSHTCCSAVSPILSLSLVLLLKHTHTHTL